MISEMEYNKEWIQSLKAADKDMNTTVKGLRNVDVDTPEHNRLIKKATYKFVRELNHICNGDAIYITVTNMKGLTQDREATVTKGKLYDMKKARLRLEMGYF